MEISGTITSKGQITIPGGIRALMGLHPGDKVAFEVTDQHKVEIRKKPAVASLAGMLSRYGKDKTLSDADIRAAIAQGVIS